MDKINDCLKIQSRETGMSKTIYQVTYLLEPIAPTKLAKGLALERFQWPKSQLKLSIQRTWKTKFACSGLTLESLSLLTRDLESFCENFLFCHLSEFEKLKKRLMNYTIFGNLRQYLVLISDKARNQRLPIPVFNYRDKDLPWRELKCS